MLQLSWEKSCEYTLHIILDLAEHKADGILGLNFGKKLSQEVYCFRYAIGGYDGDSMVSSVEIFDPRLNAWRMGDPMSNPRGYASAVTFDDSLFVLGGLRSNEQILDTVSKHCTDV